MKHLTLLWAICLVLPVSGQDITPAVLSSAGSSVQNEGILLQWTLGELSIRSSKNDNLILSEGFNQLFAFDMSTAVETLKLDEEVVLHPNPVRRILTVSTEHSDVLKYSIYNISGKLISDGHFQSSVELEMGDLVPGDYFLLLTTRQNNRGIYAFIKI